MDKKTDDLLNELANMDMVESARLRCGTVQTKTRCVSAVLIALIIAMAFCFHEVMSSHTVKSVNQMQITATKDMAMMQLFHIMPGQGEDSHK